MSKTIRTTGLVVATAASLAAGAAAAQASDVQEAYRQHTANCIGLFFSDASVHAAECLPNNIAVPAPVTTGSGPAVAPPPVVLPPPPPPPPPTPPGSSYPTSA